MQVIYLNVNAGAAPEIKDIADNLNTFHELIDCDTIDIPRRRIGKRYFRIVCDDEGLLKENPKISAISNAGEIHLVGNLIVFSGNISEHGDLVGITDEEAEYIKRRIRFVRTHKHPEGYYILTECEF